MTQRQPDRNAFDTRAEDLVHIEQLIADLPTEPDTVEGLMREHLDTARQYLLNSMPEEYGLNMKLAKELLPNIEDEALRARIRNVLEHLHPLPV
jgi:hypothetical protein